MKLTTIILPALTFANLPFDSIQSANTNISNSQIQKIEQITKDTIANNPALLAQQIEKYQTAKILSEQELDQQIISRNKTKLLDQYNGLSYGNPQAEVIVVEFVDYNCKHCQQLTHTIKEATYNDQHVRVIVKQLPILGRNSINAAKAVIAASKQGHYLKFQNSLLSNKQAFTENNLIKIAQKLQLNLKQFRLDYASKATQNQIDANFNLAKDLFIKATPTVIVTNPNASFGKIIPGSMNLTQFKQLVDIAKSSIIKQKA